MELALSDTFKFGDTILTSGINWYPHLVALITDAQRKERVGIGYETFRLLAEEMGRSFREPLRMVETRFVESVKRVLVNFTSNYGITIRFHKITLEKSTASNADKQEARKILNGMRRVDNYCLYFGLLDILSPITTVSKRCQGVGLPLWRTIGEVDSLCWCLDNMARILHDVSQDGLPKDRMWANLKRSIETPLRNMRLHGLAAIVINISSGSQGQEQLDIPFHIWPRRDPSFRIKRTIQEVRRQLGALCTRMAEDLWRRFSLHEEALAEVPVEPLPLPLGHVGDEGQPRHHRMLTDEFGEDPLFLDDSGSESPEDERRMGVGDMVDDENGEVMFMQDLIDVWEQTEAPEAEAEPQQPVITEEECLQSGYRDQIRLASYWANKMQVFDAEKMHDYATGTNISVEDRSKLLSVCRWFKLTDEEGAQVVEEWRGLVSMLQVGSRKFTNTK